MMSSEENINFDKLLKEATEIIKDNNLFDEEYYAKEYPQVAKEHDDLLEHYLTKGYKEGKNPSGLFDNDFYIDTHGEVKDKGINPLIHYVTYYIQDDVDKSNLPLLNQMISFDNKNISLLEETNVVNNEQEQLIEENNNLISKKQDIIKSTSKLNVENSNLAHELDDISNKLNIINNKNQEYLESVTSKNKLTKDLYFNSKVAISPRKTQSELTEDDLKRAFKIIEEHNLFDEIYYNTQYPDVIESTGDLFNHYLEKGYKEGKNPSKYFDTNYYLENNPAVKDSKINPLIYYALYDSIENVKTSDNFTEEEINDAYIIINEKKLFDTEYYYMQCPKLKDTNINPLDHYLHIGYKFNLNPSKNFNTLFYKEKYLNGKDINPLVHYVLTNLSDDTVQVNIDLSSDKINEFISVIYDSNSFDDEYYKSQLPSLKGSTRELITHYVREGAYCGLNPNKVFDSRYYLDENSRIMVDSINPYYHYLTKGIQDSKAPKISKTVLDEKKRKEKLYEEYSDTLEESKYFDEKYYVETYGDVKYSLLSPLNHYLTVGYKEGKNPSRFFDTNYYLYKYPEVKKEDINPLYHFLTEGIHKRYLSKFFLTDDDKKEIENAIKEDVKNKIYTKFDETAPLVSILILNHNGYGFLERLFSSIKENTIYPNYEIIIVDNDSQDESITLLNKFSKELPLKIIKNNINQGFTHSYNQAINEASGEYYLFLDNDVEVLPGWLNYLMDTALSNENVGAVGSKLVYPDSSFSKTNRHKSYKIQHTGIKFKQEEGIFLPYNVDNLKAYSYNEDCVNKVPAVSGSVLLVHKDRFEEVEGFDSNYNYGFEAVDLCLKLYKRGYDNYCNLNSTVFHYEHGTTESLIQGLLNKRNQLNNNIFTKKWYKWIKKQILLDKFNQGGVFTDKTLKIEFIVTEVGVNATIGDYFIALGMANSLSKLGYKTDILPFTNNNTSAYNVPDDVDVIVSLKNKFDLNQIKTNNSLLIKVAWIINWFEWWTSKYHFESYDIVFASNSKGINYLKENSGYIPILLPEATDSDVYNDGISAVEEYECDYCFAGNYWDNDRPWEKRHLLDALDPDNLPYDFNLYGRAWKKVPELKKFYKGKMQYKHMPRIYASTKIVLDDASDFTDTPSSVNARVFDALACGKLVLSNGKVGIKELFGDKLPTFDSKESLTELLNYYLSDETKLKAKVEELQDIVLKEHTYDNRAKVFLDTLKDYINSTKIMIKIPVKENNKKEWGDYHFAVELQREFIKHGYHARLQRHIYWESKNDGLYDIVLLLRGLHEYEPKPIHYNIMWNISHPDLISIGEYDSYNQVYVASEYWANALKPIVNVDIEPLLQCTNSALFHNEFKEEYDTQLLFVGNSRYIYRKVLQDLLPTDYKLDIYGAGWNGLLDEKYIVDTHISNKELYKAYSSTDILLNDHWDDMREKGFISNRIFDAIACGTVVVTDHVKGIDNLFPKDTVVVYEDKFDLNDKIKKALEIGSVDPNLINEHTFRKRAEKIIGDYEEKVE